MALGKLLIFSAPSGAGKTTIVKHLLQKYPSLLSFSVSATTRERRPYEVDGKDYYFISPEAFQAHIAAGDFLEYEQVYNGTLYGTLKNEVERIRQAGKHVIFDVDVIGGLNIKKQYGDDALAVFVKVSSIDELARRLMGRNTESEEKRRERVEKARREVQYAEKFDVILLNDHLPTALQQAEELFEQFAGVQVEKV
ncbi:guanylate kinase [Rhodoflexus caldus]|uniref:guanylate kinase n=1 Tax=Rhodoflexus caldus TaxID=2891236 RepID=UPI002029E7E7|nr:guanylate kinase [Rhodoflexus caldus]